MWQTLHIFITILLLVSCIGIVLWVFRPSSKKTYDEQSMIPMRSEDKNK
jgi:cbb3-type cytochrome oxidase subunit 3